MLRVLRQRRFQFSLTMLLLLTVAAAVVSYGLRFWINRPTSTVTVQIASDGELTIDSEVVPQAQLAAVLANRRKAIGASRQQPALRLVASRLVATADVSAVIDRASQLGYNEISLSVASPRAAATPN